MAPVSIIYSDRLSVLSFLKFLFIRRSGQLHVLEDFSRFERVFAKFLNVIGFNICEVNFHASTVLDQNGESIFFVARRDSGPLSIEIAQDVVNSSAALKTINQHYRDHSVALSIARRICLPIEATLRYGLAAKFFQDKGHIILICARPVTFPSERLACHLEGVSWVFYGNPFRLWNIFTATTEALMRGIWHSIRPYLMKPIHSFDLKDSKPSILILEDDEPHYSIDKRTVFDWHVGQSTPHFNTILWRHLNQRSKINDIDKMMRRDIFVLETARLSSIVCSPETLLTLKQVSTHQWKLVADILRSPTQIHWMMINVFFLLSLTKKVISLANQFNIKAALIKDFYFNHSDAIVMASTFCGFKVFGRQYSSLMLKSPIMMGNCDTFFIFSDQFSSTFSPTDVPSYTRVAAGYPATHNNTELRQRSRGHRQRFEDKGINFVIGYFDEAIVYDKWGLISPEGHARELEELLQYIEAYSNIGVVVKTQFMSALPSRIYAENILIKRLIKTGQYIELGQGTHRNIVAPAEAALTSDVCIGQIFGATASLEAALCGTRSLLLNPFGGRTLQDEIYEKADVVYHDIHSAIRAVQQLRLNPHLPIGDWSKIIHKFSGNGNQSSVIFNTMNTHCINSH